MGAMLSQITSLTIFYSTVHSGADKKNIRASRHWPLCGDFPAQMASNAENVPIWWRHHIFVVYIVSRNELVKPWSQPIFA